MIPCSCCGTVLPLGSYSKNQRRGKFNCPNCTGADLPPQLQSWMKDERVERLRESVALEYASDVAWPTVSALAKLEKWLKRMRKMENKRGFGLKKGFL